MQGTPLCESWQPISHPQQGGQWAQPNGRPSRPFWFTAKHVKYRDTLTCVFSDHRCCTSGGVLTRLCLRHDLEAAPLPLLPLLWPCFLTVLCILPINCSTAQDACKGCVEVSEILGGKGVKGSQVINEQHVLLSLQTRPNWGAIGGGGESLKETGRSSNQCKAMEETKSVWSSNEKLTENIDRRVVREERLHYQQEASVHKES